MTTEPKKEEQKPLNGQASAEQITKWKAANKYGIYFIKNKKDTDIAYFREPFIHDVEAAQAEARPDKPYAAIKKFGELTMIGGSEKILKDDMMFLGAKSELAKHWTGEEMESGNL